MNLKTMKLNIFKSEKSQMKLFFALLLGAVYTLLTSHIFLSLETPIFWSRLIFFFSLLAPIIYLSLRERFSVFLKDEDSKNTIYLKAFPYFFSLMSISWIPIFVSVILAESANLLETSIILFLCILVSCLASIDRCTDLLFWRELDKNFGMLKNIV